MIKNVIPFVDLRGKSPADLARSYPDKARDLIASARRTYGIWTQLASLLALPFADKKSAAWLARNGNPYLHEIDSMAEILEVRGVHMLNICYEWGCTSGAWRTEDSVSMLRVLDWPFPSLGKHVMVARQKGKAGEFYNITWPGISGVFTGMAPGRFSATINQAPMRRHRLGFVGDWLKNRVLAYRQNALPAAHLLRQVFEQAASYAQAKEMLAHTPLAVPAVFVLAGTQPGEGCIIERLENRAELLELSADQYVHTTNHFNSAIATDGKGWRPRELDSAGRYKQSASIGGHELAQPHFSWLQAPVINVYTRLCVIADAATGRLMVQGFEGSLPVTEIFNLPTVSHAQQEAV